MYHVSDLLTGIPQLLRRTRTTLHYFLLKGISGRESTCKASLVCRYKAPGTDETSWPRLRHTLVAATQLHDDPASGVYIASSAGTIVTSHQITKACT